MFETVKATTCREWRNRYTGSRVRDRFDITLVIGGSRFVQNVKNVLSGKVFGANL
jgi:hypothetical protein